MLSQSQTSDSSSSAAAAATPVVPTAAQVKLARSAALYHLLNASSHIDHPLCIECADALQELMNAQLDTIKTERTRFLQFEKETIAQEQLDNVDAEKLHRDLEQLEKEDKIALQQLKQAEQEQANLQKQMQALDAEDAELRAQEEKSVNIFPTVSSLTDNT